ncbi:YfgM family protein [Ramlibacter sp.]|uniref:YfgM family protein n=1 Tax=Ramlibacter sp. TaxID=1917967 RepID=UPI0035AF3378
MARQLDLEEQEQLDQLRHFWKQYGNAITWFLIAVLGGFAAWNGWQYWQRSQAAQASVLYDEIDRAAGAGDPVRAEQAFNDIRDKFGRTTYAHQGGLMAARVLAQKGKADAARAALQWVADSSGDAGLKAVARLRLAGLQVEAKAFDDALKTLSAAFPAQFEGLAADRRGDVYNLQGKGTEAQAEYAKAWKALDAEAEYRTLVEAKLTALGFDMQTLKPAAQPAVKS